MSQRLKLKSLSFFRRKEPEDREAMESTPPPSPGYLKTTATTSRVVHAAHAARNKRVSASGILDLVQCPLCLEKFHNPKMLPCQHTFCLACLKAHAVGRVFLECPICLQKFNLSLLDNLPSNLYIDSLLRLVGDNSVRLEDLAAPKSPPVTQGEVSCELFAAGVRCSNCKSLVDNYASVCCKHCKLTFCQICWMQHLEDLKIQTVSITRQMDSARSKLEHKLEIFKDRCERLKENILTTTEDKINEILQQKEELLKKANVIEKTGDITALAIKTSLNEALQVVEESATKDNIYNDDEKISVYMNLHQNAIQIISDVNKWDEQTFIFDKEKFCIDIDIAAPSEAESEEPLVLGHKENFTLESEDNLVIHYQSRNFIPHYVWRKISRPGGIGLNPWTNHLYICGMDSHSVIVVERTHAKIVARLTHPDMLCPINIAFMKSTGEIYVTDKWKHCVHVFSKDGEYVRCIGQKGSRPGMFRSPEGLSADCANNLLYVVDTGNDRVQILQPDGKYIGQIGMITKPVPNIQAGTWQETSTECTELNTPTGIALTSDRVIILDSGNRRVKVYNKTDRSKLFEFGSLGQRKGQFRQPEVIAVDKLGFIVVGDSGNSRVQVFKPSGQLVRVFGGLGSEPGKFGWISGIFVTKELDVIISDSKNHCVNFCFL